MRRKLIQAFVITLFFLSISSSIASILAQGDKSSAETITLTVSTKKYVGVCYGPFRDNEAPGYYPTLEELREDINFISKLSNSIRTYGMAGTLSEIPKLCQEADIDCYPGAWISKQKEYNEREIQSLIQVANQNLSCVRGLIVGNEVLLREDVPEDELIEYIRGVKDNTTIPVSTAEIWGTWLEHPQLAENVDFIIVHIHPYWEGYPYYGKGHPHLEGIPVNDAAEHVVEKWKEVKAKYPNKTVIVGETGWPTQGEKMGEAIPSEENQRIFLSDFLQLAEENGIQYFYYEVFNEKWKKCSEEAKEVEAHWGLYYSNGSLKPLLEDLVPEEVREGFYRLPRERKVPLPWYVYRDAWSLENHFIPSGWMGDLVGWPSDPEEVFDDACTDAPYSGDTCVRITYSPGPKGWSGIYWQFPENNWGKCPGYDISNATKLIFWARGEKGGEKAEFKTGGINSPGKPYQDSFGPVSTEPPVIGLTKEWKEYNISVGGENLSMVIGGFCWVTNQVQNPEGCMIYLDNISFVGHPAKIYVPDDYERIQWAVNNASAGDTIIVRDGTYIENIKINKRLTIKSENGSENCTVQAKDSNDDVFVVTADYVNISGFTITDANAILSAGIYLYADYCNISNNNCSNNFWGIRLEHSNNSIISNNNCSLNNEDGIYHAISNNNIISNNTCLNNGGGIDIYNSNNNSISNNNCSNNYYGIFLSWWSNNNSISNNICSSNNEDGIFLEAVSDNNIISNNNCSNNNYSISLLLSSNNIISNNNCSNNGYGIYLSGSNNIISNNNCSNNRNYGIYLHYGSNNNIYLNNFINNTKNAYYFYSKSIWNSTSKITYTYNGTTYENYLGNYWDDYKGSDANEDGIGDTPYSMDFDADYYPLMEPWENYFKPPEEKIFDTGAPANPYPSIFGTHNGTIKPDNDIFVQRMYTYPCSGTGGHTEYVKIWNDTWNVTANWSGYKGDWHNISFDKAFMLVADETYNYTIKTGSYPQIIHEKEFNATGGIITCTSFVDANGKSYNDWIPAIRFFW